MTTDSFSPAPADPVPPEPCTLPVLLPMRSGLNMAEYHLSIMGDTECRHMAALPPALCGQEGQQAVIFADDTGDSGHVFQLRSCTPEVLGFTPLGDRVWDRYGRCLVFLESATEIFSFFTLFRGVAPDSGFWHFDAPRFVYHRPKRQRRRLALEVPVVLRRRDGRVEKAVLHDFSPGGASFFTDGQDFRPGEVFLLEFEVPGCSTCETLVTAVRTDARSGPRGTLVAVRLVLTEKQKKQVEHLLLCQEYPQLRAGTRDMDNR